MILPAELTNILAVKRENLLIEYLIESIASSTFLGVMHKEKDVEFQVKPSHSKHCTGCNTDFSKLINKPAFSKVSLTCKPF